MEDYIVPIIFLIVLFVGFGLSHKRGQGDAGCASCSSCSDKSECTKQ